MTITFPWPSPTLSPNARVHWGKKARAAKAYREACFWEGWKHRDALIGRYCFSVTFCPPDNHRRDEDNMIASCKALFDALSQVAAVDDSKFEITYSRGPVTKGGAVLVEVLG